MPKFTLLLLTHNSQQNIKNFNWIKKCLQIGEIVVIDDKSEDKTLEELQKLKLKNLKIYKRELVDDFSAQRNFGISKTKNDWIIWLDSDERPSDKFIKFIDNFDFTKNNIFAFKRIDIFLGKELNNGETASLYFTRIFNKKYGKFEGKVHETWVSNKEIEKLDINIYHQSHQDINSFLKKINFYTDLRSKELYEKKVRTNIFEILVYPFGKFIQNYILRFGFLDSTPGIIIALLMSFHSFLVRAKLWQLYQK